MTDELLKLRANPNLARPEEAEETARITERIILQLEDALPEPAANGFPPEPSENESSPE